MPHFMHHHFVYRNLHKWCWSLRSRKGRVTAHGRTVLAFNATFKVNEAGRQRVIREGRKNVHAGVDAVTVIADPTGTFHLTDRIPRARYNPYSCEYFYDPLTRRGLHHAFVCFFPDDSGIPYHSGIIITAGSDNFLCSEDFNDWARRIGYTGIARWTTKYGSADYNYCNGYVDNPLCTA